MKLKRLLSLAMLCVAWVGAFAYEVGQDITSLAKDWTGKTGTYQSKYAEKYSNTAYTEGKILYMSITGLKSVGYYEVQFYAVTSMAWNQFATGTSIAEWYVNDVSDYMNVIKQTDCTPESETNLRTATVYVSDGNLEFGIKNIAEGGNWYVAHVKSIVYKGNPSLSNPINITSTYIKNAGYETGDTKGWTTTPSSDTGAYSTTSDKYKFSNSEGAYLFNTWWKGTPCVQTISSSMPAGKYELSAIVGSDGATIYLITGDNSAEYAYTETTDGAVGIKLAKEFLLSSDATNYKIGVVGGANGTAGEHKAYVEDGYWWYKSDNFQLKYYGNGIDVYAEAKNLGVEFTTVANQWYAIPVAMDGEYIFTVGDGSTITYTQNGTQPISSATGNSATSGTAYTLKAGYVYVKAASATTIKLSAHTKTYNVGSATTATPYIQAGQTVTVTYADAKTNDEAATFAHLTGNITLNGTAVDVNVTGRSFTFTLPANATTSTTYTLSIPAGAFGYEGHETCDAQTITFTTPAVFDGTYFIKATDETYGGKYISRGADSNTEAALDPWGLPVTITTDANNVSTIYFVDNNKPLVLNANNIAYTDGKLSNANHKYTYTIAATADGCTLYNIDKAKYLAAGVRNGNEVATASDEPYSWAIVTPANHTAEMTALKDNQAAAAAKTAGQTAATVAELKAIVEAWKGNTTENLTLADSGKEFYSDEGNQGIAVGTYSKTVTISKAGLYKFSMPAYTRASGVNETYANHLTETEALVAYIFFGDYKTQIRSLYSESGKDAAADNYVQPTGATQWWPNRTGAGDTEFAAGKYANEIWMYLEAGEYTYGITNASKGLCESWTYFNAPTLTSYSENLYPTFAELYAKCAPWTTGGAYETEYAKYASYTAETALSTLQAAIDYMNENFKTYAWDNASIEHPYDTEKIVNPSYDSGLTGWDKTQNSTGGYNEGIDANGNNYYYTANSQIRHATIYQEGITLQPGTYRLSANMYGDILNETSTYIYATDGKVDHWTNPVFAGNVWMGYLTTTNEWTNVSCYIVLTAETTLRIGALSWGVNRDGNTKGNFRVDDWKLEYVKYVVDNTDGVVTAYGPAPLAEINSKISANTNVVDLSEASDLSNAAITTANPNMIIYAKSGAVSNSNNVVIDGICKNLVLTDGHSFKATKNFTANSATYTMDKVVTTSSGATFGTLMLPYAVTTLPGKAYSLDQGVTFGGDIYATEVSSINANTPVLVTASGKYEAKGVSVAPTADTHTNGELVGTYKKMTALDNTYVLQKHNNYVAFFMVDAEKTTTKPTVNPFRAYIKAQSGASSKQFINVILDGETTAISNVENQNSEDEVIYDLSGRKVTKAGKGVYIINGKKIVK